MPLHVRLPAHVTTSRHFAEYGHAMACQPSYSVIQAAMDCHFRHAMACPYTFL